MLTNETKTIVNMFVTDPVVHQLETGQTTNKGAMTKTQVKVEDVACFA